MFELDDALSKWVSKPDPLSKPELILLYSQPGGGKTHTAATASQLPGVKKVLYLDVEGSTVGVLSNFDADKLDVIRLDQNPTPIPLFDTIIKRLGTEETGYDVVVVDPMDVLQDMKIKSLEARGLEGWDVWREVADWSLNVARTLKKIEALGIIVIHEREEKSESGAIISRLRISGSAKDTLPGVPDLVMYLTRSVGDDEKVHTYGFLESNDRKVTKNRFQFPAVVQDVTLPGLWKFIDKKASEKE